MLRASHRAKHWGKQAGSTVRSVPSLNETDSQAYAAPGKSRVHSDVSSEGLTCSSWLGEEGFLRENAGQQEAGRAVLKEQEGAVKNFYPGRRGKTLRKLDLYFRRPLLVR